MKILDLQARYRAMDDEDDSKSFSGLLTED